MRPDEVRHSDVEPDGEITYYESAERRVTDLVSGFERNLRDVSQAFASLEEAEVVIERHVTEAFGAITALGLSRKRAKFTPEIPVCNRWSADRACVFLARYDAAFREREH